MAAVITGNRQRDHEFVIIDTSITDTTDCYGPVITVGGVSGDFSHTGFTTDHCEITTDQSEITTDQCEITTDYIFGPSFTTDH